MLDIPSISVSFILHALLVAGLLLWNTAGEKKPRVEYNFLKGYNTDLQFFVHVPIDKTQYKITELSKL